MQCSTPEEKQLLAREGESASDQLPCVHMKLTLPHSLSPSDPAVAEEAAGCPAPISVGSRARPLPGQKPRLQVLEDTARRPTRCVHVFIVCERARLTSATCSLGGSFCRAYAYLLCVPPTSPPRNRLSLSRLSESHPGFPPEYCDCSPFGFWLFCRAHAYAARASHVPHCSTLLPVLAGSESCRC